MSDSTAQSQLESAARAAANRKAVKRFVKVAEEAKVSPRVILNARKAARQGLAKTELKQAMNIVLSGSEKVGSLIIAMVEAEAAGLVESAVFQKAVRLADTLGIPLPFEHWRWALEGALAEDSDDEANAERQRIQEEEEKRKEPEKESATDQEKTEVLEQLLAAEQAGEPVQLRGLCQRAKAIGVNESVVQMASDRLARLEGQEYLEGTVNRANQPTQRWLGRFARASRFLQACEHATKIGLSAEKIQKAWDDLPIAIAEEARKLRALMDLKELSQDSGQCTRVGCKQKAAIAERMGVNAELVYLQRKVARKRLAEVELATAIKENNKRAIAVSMAEAEAAEVGKDKIATGKALVRRQQAEIALKKIMKEQRVEDEELEQVLKEAQRALVSEELYSPAAARLEQTRALKALREIVDQQEVTVQDVEDVIVRANATGVPKYEQVQAQALLRRLNAEVALRNACYGIRRRTIHPEGLLLALAEADEAGVSPEEITESEKLVPFTMKGALIASRARVRLERAAREGDRADLKKFCAAAEAAKVSPRIIWAARKASRQRLAQKELDEVFCQDPDDVDHQRLAIVVAEAEAAGITKSATFLGAQTLSRRNLAERSIAKLLERRLGPNPAGEEEVNQVLADAKRLGATHLTFSRAQALLQPKKAWKMAAKGALNLNKAMKALAETNKNPLGAAPHSKNMNRHQTAPSGQFETIGSLSAPPGSTSSMMRRTTDLAPNKSMLEARLPLVLPS